ncbi:isocitrate lyase/PEP mutase family protein [Methylovirgula sp. 4M-Z18]|uniref:isocitrate lyase/PEP mutase family protein n=1 Tax=Methylovirgula sp. 4M-Z18 TaxID=2293567 RepID=UPI000E2F6BFD|nr:isocitrate lyase/phosphoenolpyruvate mutase family protein [Methylovirgula sp. 4M-Z18]RFB77999.1 isocitrate lyase/phosphoenolpyruvate mutase family protein [Methylovirgula sp. 4M-Z18]
MSKLSLPDIRAKFRALHDHGCFVIPNAWDVGSAVYLQHMGFPAVASTSAGFAFTLARPDNGIPLSALLQHLRDLSGELQIGVNADFENAFADDLEGVAANVTKAVATGVSGLSVEDLTGRKDKPLYDFDLAVRRIRAARAAIDATGENVMLIARTECFWLSTPGPFDEAIKRATAFAEAGADCIFVPGALSREQIATLVKEVAPHPVSVIRNSPGLTVSELADLGVRRISVGPLLARAAWTAFVEMAKEIRESGSFDSAAKLMPTAPLNELFAQHAAQL